MTEASQIVERFHKATDYNIPDEVKTMKTIHPKSMFSERLIKLRKAKGLSQEQLAAALHIPRHKIAYFETKAANPTADSLSLLANYFGVPVSHFIEQEDAAARKRGPESELEARFKKLRELPKSQQRTVLAMLDGLIKPLQHAKGG
jgi:transcriptional regulator with XRE-family HTH domain